MALLDLLVDSSFRDEKEGRVVVFQGGPRGRGYLVRSQSDEHKIRSFLKMFFCAHLSIIIFGILLANAWSSFFNNVFLERPALHPLEMTGISLTIFFVVMGIPYFLFWRIYRKAVASFVSPQDEVQTTGTRPTKQRKLAVIFFVAATIMLLAGIFLMVGARPK